MFNPYLLLSAVLLLVLGPVTTPPPVLQATAPAAASAKKTAKSSPEATEKAKEAAEKAKEAMDKAKKVYAVDCALCHGEKGDGKTDLAKDMQLSLGDWTDPKTLANVADKDMFNAIRNGKGKMPAEAEARATNDELNNVIAYIRSMSKAQSAVPEAPAAPTN